MTMLDGALDVETVARPAARSPDDRAALAYLAASGATAITITEHDGVCAFRLGSKIDPRAVMVQWLPETNAGRSSSRPAVMLAAARMPPRRGGRWRKQRRITGRC
jgi:hypothetical protein